MAPTIINTPGSFTKGEPLRPDISKAFQQLFSDSNWQAFEKASFEYFNANPTDFEAHRKFFEHFTPQWRRLCDDRMYTHAEDLWAKAIEITVKWESMKSGCIHKGTPYYFWGGTSILKGEIDLGFVLIHEALAEDIRTESSGGKPADTLPAWSFVTLNDEKQEQYWKPLVQDLATFFKSCLSIYNHDCEGSLTLLDFKSRFLHDIQYREATFFFVYSLWKYKRQLDTSKNLTNSPFSTLVQLDSTLNLYVVLEELLKVYYGNEKTLHPLVEEFSIAHEIDIHQCPPRERKKRIELMHERFRNDPDTVLRDALSYSILHYTPIQIALSVAPLLRNAAAHSVRTYISLQGQASRLLQMALNAIFVVIELGR